MEGFDMIVQNLGVPEDLIRNPTGGVIGTRLAVVDLGTLLAGAALEENLRIMHAFSPEEVDEQLDDNYL